MYDMNALITDLPILRSEVEEKNELEEEKEENER